MCLKFEDFAHKGPACSDHPHVRTSHAPTDACGPTHTPRAFLQFLARSDDGTARRTQASLQDPASYRSVSNSFSTALSVTISKLPISKKRTVPLMNLYRIPISPSIGQQPRQWTAAWLNTKLVASTLRTLLCTCAINTLAKPTSSSM